MSREAEVTIAALIGGAKFSATIRISVRDARRFKSTTHTLTGYGRDGRFEAR